jgi:hypothetical protein
LIRTNGRIMNMKRAARVKEGGVLGEEVSTSAREVGAEGQGVGDLGEDRFGELGVAVDAFIRFLELRMEVNTRRK